jgi:hypothetical protein
MIFPPCIDTCRVRAGVLWVSFSSCFWPALRLECSVAFHWHCFFLAHLQRLPFSSARFSSGLKTTAPCACLWRLLCLFVSLLCCFALAHCAPWSSFCVPTWSRLFCSCLCILLCSFHIFFLCFSSACCASGVLLICPVSAVSVVVVVVGRFWTYTNRGVCLSNSQKPL